MEVGVSASRFQVATESPIVIPALKVPALGCHPGFRVHLLKEWWQSSGMNLMSYSVARLFWGRFSWPGLNRFQCFRTQYPSAHPMRTGRPWSQDP